MAGNTVCTHMAVDTPSLFDVFPQRAIYIMYHLTLRATW